MLRLEEFMDVGKLYHDGVSISEIARHTGRDRKTVRKYLHEAPQPYRRGPRDWKVDGHRGWLRERWEHGVRNATRLYRELRKRGYEGGYTQAKKVVAPWHMTLPHPMSSNDSAGTDEWMDNESVGCGFPDARHGKRLLHLPELLSRWDGD